MRHIFYLHGFASSAGSRKAGFFAERLAAHGLDLRCPDFNEPEFSTLTVSRMLRQLHHEIAALQPGPVTLIGSSLGGLVALHAAAQLERERGSRSPIEQLVLLAPALEFFRSRTDRLGDEGIARWRESDRLEVFHHGYGEMRPVAFALYEDAQQYDSFGVTTRAPILIFQGRRDDAVDPAMVERFAAGRPNVMLHLLDEDHQLLASLEAIWREMAATLGLDAAA